MKGSPSAEVLIETQVPNHDNKAATCPSKLSSPFRRPMNCAKDTALKYRKMLKRKIAIAFQKQNP